MFMQNASTMRSSNAAIFGAPCGNLARCAQNKPSVCFMMFALCTAVTLRRPCLRA